MKVLKKDEHSLMIKPFAVQGKQYVAATVFLYFDLNNPQDLLLEQEMWKTVPDLLGDPPMLDFGIPKPNGEVVVCGSCFAPRGETRTASRVEVCVGNRRKKLDVFGNRVWLTGGRISDPEPFSEMPVTYENAFGGKNFAHNPIGKGIDRTALHKDKELVALPNIEDPSHTIGAPEDRPEPVGFAPLDMMWPQRAKKTGTYDDRWLRERWPHFPDDMDYTFFNVTPDDQQLKEYFNGGESMEIWNMHPDLPIISSRLPGKRIRCFATMRTDFKLFSKKKSFTEEFREVSMHMDTAWLFPSILRGVAVYRGVTEARDDEYGDVAYVYLASEELHESPKNLEYYLEDQQKKLDRSTPMDMAPLQEAQEKTGEAAIRIRNIPKELKKIKQAALGGAPVMPKSAADMSATTNTLVQGRLATLDKLEAMAKKMHKKWGHLAKIDLKQFDELRVHAKQMGADVKEAADHLTKTQAQIAQKKAAVIKSSSEFMKTNLKPEYIEKSGMDPDNLLPDKKVNPWHDHGFPFVVQCRREYEQNQEIQGVLCSLGFKARTLRGAWIGLNSTERVDNGYHWDVPQAPGQDPDGPNRLELPAGLIIPRFDGPVLNRILVRPGETKDELRNPQNDALVRGSADEAMYLPAVETGGPLVAVADDLQALYVEQEAGDAVGVLAMPTADAAPGEEGAKALKDANILLVITPHGIKSSSEHWQAWKKKHKNAVMLELPKGNTVFGTKIRRLILDALPQEFAKIHDVAPPLSKSGEKPKISPVPSLAFPAMNVGGLIKEIREGIIAQNQPDIDEIRGIRQQSLAEFKKHFSKSGRDPEASLKAAANEPKQTYEKMAKGMAKHVADEKAKFLQNAGGTTAEQLEKFDKSEAFLQELGQKTQARTDKQMARLAQMREKTKSLKGLAKARKLPGEAGLSMEKAGLNLNNLRVLTREDVIEMHKNGESFAKRNLTGLDLSKLDLTGIDLRQAILQKAKFTESVLDNADLSSAIAKGADFSKASLKHAVLKKSILQKTACVETDFTGANLHQTVATGADMSKATFKDATLRMMTANKAVFAETDFTDANLSLSMLADGDMNKVSFRNAKLERVVMRNNTMDHADFTRAALNSTLLSGVSGEKVTFAGANLEKLRIGGESELPGADFQNTTLHKAGLMKSNLAGADFTGAVLDTAIIDGCDLQKANLERTSAKKARFLKTNLEGANLRAVNLFMGSLRKSRLVNTDLTGSNLYAVDFFRAIVGETKFDLANLKRTQLHNRTDLIK